MGPGDRSAAAADPAGVRGRPDLPRGSNRTVRNEALWGYSLGPSALAELGAVAEANRIEWICRQHQP
jgi:hypothetical protein